MSDSVVLNVFSVHLYKVAILVDFVRNQRGVVGNDDQFASSGEVSVVVVEFVEGVSLSIHLASDCFVVSGGQVEVHGLAGVHLYGEECFVSEIENSGAVFALLNLPQLSLSSVVGPGEVNIFPIVVYIGTRYPNFVGLVVLVVVVSNVYVVGQGLFVNGLPLVLQSDLEVYTVWSDLIGVVLVGVVIVGGSFVQLSLLDQLSNTAGFLDQVDGPVLVDVASVDNIIFIGAIPDWFADFIIGALNLGRFNGDETVISVVYSQSSNSSVVVFVLFSTDVVSYIFLLFACCGISNVIFDTVNFSFSIPFYSFTRYFWIFSSTHVY